MPNYLSVFGEISMVRIFLRVTLAIVAAAVVLGALFTLPRESIVLGKAVSARAGYEYGASLGR